MCGIAGIIGKFPSNESLIGFLDGMNNALSHRGPDSRGVWSNDNFSIGLAHTRLAVLDLSHAGQQPMISNCGRFVLVFNGEIYNHLELRHLLLNTSDSFSWSGNSDSETLLECIAAWGLEKTLDLSRGMFAFGVYDIELDTLTLARDRFGEKPLYYGIHDDIDGKKFLFSSELKALRSLSFFEPSISHIALDLYFKYAYIPTPYSIYDNIYKLEPGYMLTFDLSSFQFTKSSYYNIQEVFLDSKNNTFFNKSNSDIIDQLDHLIKDVVSEQSISDVPLGVFLSGGIDSSLIASYMQENSAAPIKTFSIGYSDNHYDESAFASRIASHLGTDHHTIMVSPADCIDVMNSMGTVYDEPFADPSQIPTSLVSRYAKRSVTVVLTGDGGDEVFGGYTRYLALSKYWLYIKFLPFFLRQLISKLLFSFSPTFWNKIAHILKLDRIWSDFGYKVHKSASVLCSRDIDDLLENLIRRNMYQISISDDEHSLNLPLRKISDHSQFSDLRYMMISDMLQYLPDDVLCKVDRAAMNISLETRVPFLDPRLIEFSAKLPERLLINAKGDTKAALREILFRKVPRRLIERPKMGFGIPIDAWLRGPLKTWALDILDWDSMTSQGLLDVKIVKKLWDQHQSGKYNRQYELWTVIVFQQWLKENF